MIFISPGPAFCASGAIVPSKAELSVIIHALKVEHAKVEKAGGKFYGPGWDENLSLSLNTMGQLIADLEKYQGGA